MTGFHKAIYDFWKQFGFPVYLTGHVPKDASFPYVTIEVVEGAPFSETFLTAIGWFKAELGANVNVQRAAFLDSVKTVLSPGGLKIKTDSGLFTIAPNSSDFLSYFDDDRDKGIIGGRISYQVNYYL